MLTRCYFAPLLGAFFLMAGAAQAGPLLRCQVGYAGTMHEVTAVPGSDPYSAPSVDIGGRFRFKAVVGGEGGRVDYVKLYAYYQTSSQPVLLHAAKYLPPWPAGGAANSLTGLNALYSPDLGRELQFGCALEGLS